MKAKSFKRPPFKPTPRIPLESIAGFKEAAEAEQLARESVYLGLNENVAGYEVKPLLFRQYLLLRFIGSPLLIGTTPTPIDLARFLWMLSPQFGAKKWFRRWLFMRRCRKDFAPLPKPILRTELAMIIWEWKAMQKLERAAEVLDACRKFVKESLMDCPRSSGGGMVKDYYSDACAICNQFGRQFGTPDEVTLAMPMKVVLQKIREIKQHELGIRAGLGNPSDEILNRFMREQNAKLKAN